MKLSLLDNFVLESEVLSDFLNIQWVIERNQRQNCLFCIEKKKVTWNIEWLLLEYLVIEPHGYQASSIKYDKNRIE